MFPEDLASVLASVGLGVAGTTIVVGAASKVPTAGRCVSIRDTPGFGSVGTHDDRDFIRQPSAQVVFRDPDGGAARATAETGRAALVAVVNQDINGRHYLSIKPVGEAYDLGVDTQGRSRIALNVNGRYRMAA